VTLEDPGRSGGTGPSNGTKTVQIPDYTKGAPVRPPQRFNVSDVRAVLGIAVLVVFLLIFWQRIDVCHAVCKNARDWNEMFQPFEVTTITAVGAVIGFFFANKVGD
jgi:hypothetical protein